MASQQKDLRFFGPSFLGKAVWTASQGYCRKRCCIRSFCLGPKVPLFSSTKAYMYKQHIYFLPQAQSQGAQRRESFFSE